MKSLSRREMVAGSLAALGLAGCGAKNQSSTAGTSGGASPKLKIGLAFETLQTEYWEASFNIFKEELTKRQIEVREAVADGDSSRQLEQIKSFTTLGVDGIIVAPKDASTGVPLVREANRASIPIVFYNRPPSDNPGKYVAVQADNVAISQATVEFMAREARKIGGKFKAMILMGNLGDMNAIGRREGFDAAVANFSDTIEIVSRIPTEWNQEKAQAGATAALSANPEINFIFSSSDFLFPSLVAALQSAGKYKKIGEPGHVILGGFDGDATAYRMMKEGYLDADGVQDVYFECQQSVQAVLDMRDAKDVPQLIRDPGFVIHQGNLEADKARMWGASIAGI